MPLESAGLLMFRVRKGVLEVMLAHPGGPFWASKDLGIWGIPKGELDPAEDHLAAAKREFFEETGIVPSGPFHPLGSVRQKSGKLVTAWAFEGDCDPKSVKSNLTTIEWPPRTGKTIEIPEIDRVEFFTVRDAAEKIIPAQFELVKGLERVLPEEYVKSWGG
jgi:predicted NUDIX family NTP pyrophosphohydrolase